MSVTFGTPVASAYAASTATVAMSGVTSGQPIVVAVTRGANSEGVNVSDNFSTPYTWTLLGGSGFSDGSDCTYWLGTGGAGTSGTITLENTTGSGVIGVAIPVNGASTKLSGTAILDNSATWTNSGETTMSATSLTPRVSGEGALYMVGTQWTDATYVSTEPGSPWSVTNVSNSGIVLSIASYASPPSGSPLSATWTNNGGGAEMFAGVSVLFLPVSAPSAPTNQLPSNAAYVDATQPITFQGTYNSTDGFSQNAYALRVKLSSGSYQYWNATTNALQSSEVWNSVTVSPGASWSVTIPASTLANGNTYNWSFASQESGSNLQGSFASDFTFTTQAAPTVTVSSPSGTITLTEPTVSWTATFPGSAVQTDYRVVVETGSYGTTPGSGTTQWDSGVVASAATSVQVGTPLPNGTTCRAFVQLTETGAETSQWAYTTFTIAAHVPATPSISVVATNDPTTGLPEVEITVTGYDNELTANQSSLESDATTGWAAGSNTSIAASNTWAQDGAYSLAMTATAAGAVSAETPTGASGVACVAGQVVRAMASFHSPSTARACTVAISFYNSAGSLISTATSPSVNSTTSGNGGQAFVTTTAPAGAVTMALTIAGAGLSASEVLYADEMLLAPGTSTMWTIGGLVGTYSVTVLRSDGQYVRNAGWPSGVTTAMPSSQTLTLFDCEAAPTVSYTYVATLTTGTVSTSSSASSSVETSSGNFAWLLDPTSPSSAVGFVMNGNWQPLIHEVGQVYYPVGYGAATKSTDGSKGVGGTIPIFTSSVAQDAAIRSLIEATDVLCLLTPQRGAFYLMHDPSQDTRSQLPFSWEATTTPNGTWNWMTLGALRP